MWDFELVLKRIPIGGWKVIYRVDQRWVKNNRDLENTVYCSFQSHFQFSRLMILCFVDTQYLLALAFADNSIWGIDTFARFVAIANP